MVSFAKARTRSWLSKIWPRKAEHNKNEAFELKRYKELSKNIAKENNCFLEASKNGGMWFS
jgi:hypothetical protein